jgi:ATP-binding cassette subfamily B protein
LEPEAKPEVAPSAGLAAFVRRLVPYLRPRAKELTLAAVLLSASSGLALAGPWLIKRAVDVDIPARSVEGLVVTAILYIISLAVLLATTWFHRTLLERIGQSAMADLRVDLLAKIVSLPISFFDEQPSGKLITRVQGDVDALRAVFTSTFLTLAGDLILFVGMLGIMIWQDWKLGTVALALLPVIAVAFTLFRRKAEKRFDEQRARAADVNGFLAEHLRVLPVLQAFDRTAWARERLRVLNGEKWTADVRAERAVIMFWNGVMMTESLAIAAILIAGGSRIGQGLTIGTLILFIGYVRRFFEPLHRLSDQLQTLERARASAARILAILNRQDEPAIALPAQRIEVAKERGSIRFEDVWFAYREPRSADDDAWVLRGLTFEVPAGSRQALVGPTGHGKSTTFALLLRFHVAQKGRVLLDGQDVRSIPLDELRRRFGLVLQDTRLFPGTLAENVLLENGGEGARDVLRRIDALDLLERLPRGLATELGEGGSGLSHGERQLVALARAVARDPEVLLLDEATASVDPATEGRLQRALEATCQGRTTIAIAHRLATVRRADRILLIERGRVVEAGSREQLLAVDGRYSALEKLQELARTGQSEPRPPSRRVALVGEAE